MGTDLLEHSLQDGLQISAIHLAQAMAKDLQVHHITALALTPGFLRSEAMLDHLGVTEATWRDAIHKDPHFIESETPFYIGKAVAALAADPNIAGLRSLIRLTFETVFFL